MADNIKMGVWWYECDYKWILVGNNENGDHYCGLNG